MTPANSKPVANNLEAFFMPFTANRQFKKNPRMLAKAKGVHYWTPEGRKIIDGTAGLWCVNAGHGREEIKAAIAKQLDDQQIAAIAAFYQQVRGQQQVPDTTDASAAKR